MFSLFLLLLSWLSSQLRFQEKFFIIECLRKIKKESNKLIFNLIKLIIYIFILTPCFIFLYRKIMVITYCHEQIYVYLYLYNKISNTTINTQLCTKITYNVTNFIDEFEIFFIDFMGIS